MPWRISSRRTRATDGLEEVFETGRPDHPELNQVLFAIVEDFVPHVGTEETGGPGYQGMALAIHLYMAAPGKTDLQLDLLTMGMGADAALG